VARDRQLIAREGGIGRYRVAERLVVLVKPGNAGGGKGPQFETDAGNWHGQEIAQAIKLRQRSTTDRGRHTRKRRRHREMPRCIGVTTDEAVSSMVAQRLGWKRLRSAPCAKGVRFVREPDAGNLHVRFDERDVETERWLVY